MNPWQIVLLTIMSTFLASGLIYFFRFFILVRIGNSIIEKVIVQFPQARNISGIWEAQFTKDETSHSETARISQLCGKVWGTIQLDKAPIRKYKIVGSIKEGVLVASYEIMEPKETLDRGSFTLRLSSDGQSLSGCGSWTDDDTPAPQGHEYIWTKPSYRGINGIRIKKSPIHGKGVFANKQYAARAKVTSFDGYEVERGTKHSLTLDSQVIEGTGPLKFLNHSCNPNCYFEVRTLVTKITVGQGEELTINYLECDAAGRLRHSFKCKCKCSNCLHRIG